MRYILYSPPHEMVRPEFTKTNGEVVPRKVFPVEARALYKHKRFPSRRYRNGFPCADNELVLVQCKMIEDAKQEQAALKDYCGETFEVREYVNKQVGKLVE